MLNLSFATKPIPTATIPQPKQRDAGSIEIDLLKVRNEFKQVDILIKTAKEGMNSPGDSLYLLLNHVAREQYKKRAGKAQGKLTADSSSLTTINNNQSGNIFQRLFPFVDADEALEVENNIIELLGTASDASKSMVLALMNHYGRLDMDKIDDLTVGWSSQNKKTLVTRLQALWQAEFPVPKDAPDYSGSSDVLESMMQGRHKVEEPDYLKHFWLTQGVLFFLREKLKAITPEWHKVIQLVAEYVEPTTPLEPEPPLLEKLSVWDRYSQAKLGNVAAEPKYDDSYLKAGGTRLWRITTTGSPAIVAIADKLLKDELVGIFHLEAITYKPDANPPQTFPLKSIAPVD